MKKAKEESEEARKLLEERFSVTDVAEVERYRTMNFEQVSRRFLDRQLISSLAGTAGQE